MDYSLLITGIGPSVKVLVLWIPSQASQAQPSKKHLVTKTKRVDACNKVRILENSKNNLKLKASTLDFCDQVLIWVGVVGGTPSNQEFTEQRNKKIKMN